MTNGTQVTVYIESGDIHNYQTGEFIRKATEAEVAHAEENGEPQTGAFLAPWDWTL